MEYVFSLLPVIFFLLGLYFSDSFKLAGKSLLFSCLFWGALAAGASYYINTMLAKELAISFTSYTRYLSPIVEELLKAAFVFFLVKRRKIGFTVDGVIFGFAVGTGFSLAENIVYLLDKAEVSSMLVWILRGFGTALMHGGSTALLTLILMGGVQRDKPLILSLWPGLVMAYALHSLFNHFLLNPLLQTAILILLLPLVFTMVFRKSNSMMQDWLEIEFSSEVEMLRMIRQGQFRSTKAGAYLASLKGYFDPETIVDLYAYISLYLELSIAAKRNIMLKESGFDAFLEPTTADSLRELKQLRKQIGKAGELAIQPVVRMKHRELWKLNQLKK